MTVDKRMQVVLGLMPADAVFLHTYGYGLLWRAHRSGYVSDDNHWQAGVYTTGHESGRSPAEQLSDTPSMYKPRGEDPDAHSYTVPMSEWMGGKGIQNGTPVAVLVDEIIRLRAALDDAQAFINGRRSPP